MSDAKDVFISFTHLDNDPLYEGQAGWVAEFHRHLESRLNKLWGKESKVWRDPNLQGNDLLLPAIERQLLAVKALVSVISPRYLKSSWCQKEMVGFLRAARASGGFQVGDAVRWFKVLKTPVAPDDFPPDFPPELTEYFKELLGYPFFDVEPHSKRPREYSREFGPEAERLYHQKVYDLAWDLCGLLKKLEAAASAGPAGHRKTVYLAAATADVQGDRDRIKRELLERGHVVLGDSTLPTVAAELRETVRALLKSCDLSVHLVGSFYGLVPEGTTESAVALQNELAAEVAAEGRLRRLVRLPRETLGAEERQAAFLRRLREDEHLQAGAELLDGPLDQLKEVLLGLLAPPPPPAPADTPTPRAAAGGEVPLVYLIGDRADAAGLDLVSNFLSDRGVEVTRRPSEGSPEDLAKAHQRRLVTCDAALIYYGSTSPDWLSNELMDLRQARGYGRQSNFRARAVCLAPPGEGEKAGYRNPGLDQILRFDGQHADALEPFVQRLQAQN